MKSLFATPRAVFLILVLAALGFAAGCATTPQVDWTSRIGEYTFDQTVAELGVPTKQTKLSDGKTVAEWVTRSPSSSSAWELKTR